MIAHASSRTRAAVGSSPARPEVLVVDDSEGLRQVLTALLSGAGYAVRQAEDGAAALRSVDAGAPDLIVLDLWMPEMNGWEFLRRLRELAPPDSATPVVAMTADRSAGDRPLPVEAILMKPFLPESLLRAVEEALH